MLLRPRFSPVFRLCELGDDRIVVRDDALRVFKTTRTDGAGQSVSYLFGGNEYSFRVGDIRATQAALSRLHDALVADPVAKAVLTEREARK